MPPTFGDQVRAFNASLSLEDVKLPNGIRAMNPFQGEHAALIDRVTSAFYGKFYGDTGQRHMSLGINPGRHGAGLTGTPFTDTKRLNTECGIEVTEISSHEVSSVFVYEVIKSWGGPVAFYEQFYIGNVCPLGFVRRNAKGNEVNCNYYDDKALQTQMIPFIKHAIEAQIDFGIACDKVFVMGSGKNFAFVDKLNKEMGWFEQVIPLDHPRFVVQYRTKRMPEYVDKYLNTLRTAMPATY